MHIIAQGLTIATLAICYGWVAGVSAAPPAHKTIQYNIHYDPSDPSSPVALIITLELDSILVREDLPPSTGGSIGWELAEIHITEPGTPDIEWTDSAPVIDTPDGLWWTDHADIDAPHRLEFVLPPLLEGTALAVDPADDDLDYYFEGLAYDPSPDDPVYPVTASMDYMFTLAGDVQALHSGTEEPVELPDGVNDT